MSITFSILFLVHLLYPTGAIASLDEVIPFVQVDAYAPCLMRGDAYCFVSAALRKNTSSRLYNSLAEHSADKLKHFNRTNIYRGICLKTCNNFTSSNVTETIESCLNAALHRDYGLTARVFRSLCSEYVERVQWDASDYAFGAVLAGLVMLNLFGTLYDVCGFGNDTIAGGLLSCFSIRRNWQRLVAPSSDPRQRRLLSLSGYRVIHTAGVLLAHAGIGGHYALENPEFYEQSYDKVQYMLLYRSMEMLQIFFIISAILLSYNILAAEAHAHWRNIHKVLLRRWLRFTPTYALVLFFYATWARRVGEGPFWRATIEVEANDCRRDWWLHLLYIHNYVDNSRCMVHSWYLATDMQLTCLGVCIFFLLKSSRARKTVIALVLAVGLLTPPAAIYFKNLHPVFIISPELFLNWVAHDPTFNYLYKRGHTNLVCYALGLGLGYVIYNLKETDFGAEKYKKYRALHWLLLPLAAVLQLSGSVFYVRGDAPPAPRLLFSSTVRLATGACMCAHVFLTVVAADGLLSRIYQWRGWAPLARLTFCVYLLHMSVLRFRTGLRDSTYHASGYTILQSLSECAAVSALLAGPLHLLAEAPLRQLAGVCLAPRLKKRAD